VEQGKLHAEDERLFVNGSLDITSDKFQVRIGIGSPPRDEFTTIPVGAIRAEAESSAVYKKVFITRITSTGSLLGES
jgi:hypothetical protein